MNTPIAVFVQQAYDRAAYKKESYNVRKWAGLEMIKQALERADLSVDYTGSATVSRYKIVLVSITSTRDWYSFVKERISWANFTGVVIVGGAGVMNIRPVLPFIDVIVWGRGEEIIVPLVKGILGLGPEYIGPSVAWARDFTVDGYYTIAQAERPWLYNVRLANGQTWKEGAIGCNHKCSFCAYTHHRQWLGAAFGDDYVIGSSHMERAVLDFIDLPIEDWFPHSGALVIGLDGLSERLRRLANKPITNEMITRLFTGLARLPKTRLMRLFNIIGYPTETLEEWVEFVEAVAKADMAAPTGPRWYISLHSTPFKALPATPAAGWPMSLINYPGLVRDTLAPAASTERYKFFEGARFSINETYSTESLASTLLEALILRGLEADSEILARLATTSAFWSAPTSRKIATLEKNLDVDRLTRRYFIDDYPVRYLNSYRTVAQMFRVGDALLNKWGNRGDRAAEA